MRSASSRTSAPPPQVQAFSHPRVQPGDPKAARLTQTSDCGGIHGPTYHSALRNPAGARRILAKTGWRLGRGPLWHQPCGTVRPVARRSYMPDTFTATLFRLCELAETRSLTCPIIVGRRRQPRVQTEVAGDDPRRSMPTILCIARTAEVTLTLLDKVPGRVFVGIEWVWRRVESDRSALSFSQLLRIPPRRQLEARATESAVSV